MTYNGLVWKEVQSKEMKGYTSRAMEFHNGKVYVATVDEQGFKPYLYIQRYILGRQKQIQKLEALIKEKILQVQYIIKNR